MEEKKKIIRYKDLEVSNETQVSICQSKDIYSTCVDVGICDQLINEYDIISKQLYRLREAWSNFQNQEIKTL